MQEVQPLACTLSGGQVIQVIGLYSSFTLLLRKRGYKGLQPLDWVLGLCPRFPPFPAAEGGEYSNEDQPPYAVFAA